MQKERNSYEKGKNKISATDLNETIENIKKGLNERLIHLVLRLK